jgi:hypothetical protein
MQAEQAPHALQNFRPQLHLLINQLLKSTLPTHAALLSSAFLALPGNLCFTQRTLSCGSSCQAQMRLPVSPVLPIDSSSRAGAPASAWVTNGRAAMQRKLNKAACTSTQAHHNVGRAAWPLHTALASSQRTSATSSAVTSLKLLPLRSS